MALPARASRTLAAAFFSSAPAPAARMAAAGPLQAQLEARLRAALAPVAHLEIENESYKHSVPAGSESHFKVFVVSPAFAGVPLLQRHRMVNDAAKGGGGAAALPFHALSIQAKTPEQWAAGAGAAMQSTPNCKGGSKADAGPVAGSV